MTKLESVIGDYNKFLDKLFLELKETKIELSDFVQCDHICYRTVSSDNYTAKKAELTKVGSLLTETKVNGRPISTFRLHQPILYKQWRIDCVELPAPKEKSKHIEGLEHVEFVLYDPIAEFIKKYPHLNFELRSADRGINPEVGLALQSCGVKFHILSLQTATYLEKKLKISEVADS